MYKVFLSTPSARRATAKAYNKVMPGSISIHALREEGDAQPSKNGDSQGYFYPRPPRGGRLFGPGYLSFGNYISIHALREEGDFQYVTPIFKIPGFLSTPSARRATAAGKRQTCHHGISIHALREEGDCL